MSDEPIKRQKTTAMASPSVSAIFSLPPELLETIFGFLDVGTLCTARLVCRQFHGTASSCLHSVKLSVETLRSRPETTLNNFPNLSRVSVFDMREDDLLMLAQGPLADAVTDLQAADFLRQVPRRGRIGAPSPLLPLPNLMSLTVSHAVGHAFPFPQTLRELTLEGPVTHQTANLVTRLAHLTCLRIDVLNGMPKPFEAVTALTALQRLDISCSSSLIPFVADLTLLTHLQFRGMWSWDQPSGLALASLTRLHRLVHLWVWHFSASWEPQLQASIGPFTSLRSLDLCLCYRPEQSAFETACMTPFSQLTALRLEGYDFMHASFLPRFNSDASFLPRLRDLSLSLGVELDRDGVAALRRATGLTHLELWKLGASVRPEEWGAALACMSRLRALNLGPIAASQISFCCEAIGLLAELTRLEWRGQGVSTNAHVEAFLGLKKLHVLSMSVFGIHDAAPSDRVSPETVFAVAKLPELRKFFITSSSGIFGGAWQTLYGRRLTRRGMTKVGLPWTSTSLVERWDAWEWSCRA